MILPRPLTYCYVLRLSVVLGRAGASPPHLFPRSFLRCARHLSTHSASLPPLSPLSHSLAFILRPSLPPRPVGGLARRRPRLGPKSQSSARFRVIRSVIQSQSSGARDQQQPRLQVSRRFVTLSLLEYLASWSNFGALGIDADLVSNLSVSTRY